MLRSPQNSRTQQSTPIVSTVGSPTYSLAKFMSNLLSSKLPKPKSYIQNSTDLINKFKNITIPQDHILIS